MAGIVSTHVAEGPQTPGFGPMAEMPSAGIQGQRVATPEGTQRL